MVIALTNQSKNQGERNESSSRSFSKRSILPTLSIVLVYVLVVKDFIAFSPDELFKLMPNLLDDPYYDQAHFGQQQQEVSSNQVITANQSNQSKPSKPIRKWGCHRTETPLIFVHIGKAGGGEVRTSLAYAAENYNRKKWHITDDNHYYPIRDRNRDSNRTLLLGGDNDNDNDNDELEHFRRGRFCNSKYSNNRKIPKNNYSTPLSHTGSFEGDSFCNATTPFGMIIGCPLHYMSSQTGSYRSSTCEECDDDYYLESQFYKVTTDTKELAAAAAKFVNPSPPDHTCDTVYVSHNLIGGELNWLPKRYLKEHWWDNIPWNNKPTTKYNSNGSSSSNSSSNHLLDELDPFWASLLSDRKLRKQSLLKSKEFLKILKSNNHNATDIDIESVDNNSQKWCPAGYKVGRETLYDRPKRKTTIERFNNCHKPIAENADRVFQKFWNNEKREQGSMINTVFDGDYSPVYASMPLHRVTMIRDPWTWLISKFYWHHVGGKCDQYQPSNENPNMSWIELYSTQYLMYLCGYECEIRYQNNMITLEEIEAQADGNLRNSFSVVGLLHESESFYEMIHKRVDYMNLKKDAKLKGQRHKSSGNKEEKERCTELFSNNEAFRENIRSTFPVVAALERIYDVGVEVNRFQKEELSQCE